MLCTKTTAATTTIPPLPSSSVKTRSFSDHNNNYHKKTKHRRRVTTGGGGGILHNATAVAAVSTTVAVYYYYYYYNNHTTTTQLDKHDTNEPQQQQLQQYYYNKKKQQQQQHLIPVDFVDRLAKKPYLTYNNNNNSDNNRRPPGVPKQLRILSIDVPQMKDEAFRGGTCRVSSHHVFPPDGVAPPKKRIVQSAQDDAAAPAVTNTTTTTTSTTSIPQKALVHSMAKCMMDNANNNNNNGIDNDDDDDDDYYGDDDAKVLVMQASIADLNPHNVRKTRQFGNLYRYDPGKYTNNNKNNTNQPQPQPQSTVDIEMDAPWNQYAWMDELRLRIAGHVRFGAPMEASSKIDRYLFGSVYKPTVPSSRSKVWDWFLWFVPFSSAFSSPSLLPAARSTSLSAKSSSRNNSSSSGSSDTGTSNNSSSNKNSSKKNTVASSGGGGAAGIDGCECYDDYLHTNKTTTTNWASNKPHAVIANGAALQRVPASLAVLQRYCQQSSVPLYVIDDPRVWGGNTHESFPEALRDMKHQIKRNIVVHAMEQQSGFQRGRILGNLEAEWIHYRRLAELEKKRKQQSQRDKRWGRLNADEIEQKFIEYGILLQPQPQEDDEDNDNKRQFSQGMKDFIRKWILTDRTFLQEQQQEQQQQQQQDDDELLHDTALSEAEPT